MLGVLAEGCTNREIAHRLFISERTVAVHVGNILAKLGASGRVEAAMVALRLGLVPSTPPATAMGALARPRPCLGRVPLDAPVGHPRRAPPGGLALGSPAAARARSHRPATTRRQAALLIPSGTPRRCPTLAATQIVATQ